MRSAIFALVFLQIFIPGCLADKAPLSRPSEQSFAAAAAAGAFAADCQAPAQERSNSAEPLHLLQVTRAAHRQALAARGEENSSQLQQSGPANESVPVKDALHLPAAGPGNASLAAKADVESERIVDVERVVDVALEAASALSATSRQGEKADTRHAADKPQSVEPKDARQQLAGLGRDSQAAKKGGASALQTGAKTAASAISGLAAASVVADESGINSTSATAVLFLIFMMVVFCALYAVTSQLRFEPMPGMPGGGPGKIESMRSPEAKSSSVSRLPPTGTGSRLKLEQGTPGGFSTSPYRDTSFDMAGGVPETESELPMIYPSLVMPVARTRLAIPVEPLADASFEVDVLGVSGVPLLCAALAARSDGMPEIQISLNSAGMLLAVVTPSLQLFNAHGSVFGALSRSGDAGERYTLHDPRGRPLLSLLPGVDAGEVKIVSQVGSRHVERASMIRKAPGGRLPAEHYEIVVSPGVDAVLVLACFLALVVFALPGKGL